MKTSKHTSIASYFKLGEGENRTFVNFKNEPEQIHTRNIVGNKYKSNTNVERERESKTDITLSDHSAGSGTICDERETGSVEVFQLKTTAQGDKT